MTVGHVLGDQMAALDEERFVGRAAERRRAARLWTTASAAPRVLVVHGPGGLGKSALLRAIGRDATAAGRTVVWIDARPVEWPEVLVDRIAGAPDDAVFLVDDAGHPVPRSPSVPRLIAGILPSSAAIVFTSRQPPGRDWSDAGLDHCTDAIRLQPLQEEAALELLAHLGVTDPEAAADVASWSEGYPVALVLRGREVAGAPIGAPRDAIGDVLFERLADEALHEVDPLVLEVAALARAVDAQMLAAVLPGRATRESLQLLRASSASERRGQRVALHSLLRRAVTARAGVGAHRRSELTLRLADHLATRIPDDPDLLADLAELIADPTLRAAATGHSTLHVVDRVRPGDAAAARARWDPDDRGWGGRFQRWCEEAPTHVTCVRGLDGELAGIGVSGPLDRIPGWARQAPELEGVIAHAEAREVVHDALFLHELHLVGVPGDACHEDARRTLVGAVVARHGPSRRHLYFTSDEPMDEDCARAFAYDEVVELRRRDGARTLRTWASDAGPGGSAARIRDAVVAEHRSDETRAAAVSDLAHDVIAALRSYRDADALRRNPLANPKRGDEQRGPDADAARQAVRRAVDDAFGSNADDGRLRRAIEVTYLDPDGGTRQAMRELHMSRSSLFRHLKKGRERIVAALSSGGDPTPDRP